MAATWELKPSGDASEVGAEKREGMGVATGTPGFLICFFYLYAVSINKKKLIERI